MAAKGTASKQIIFNKLKEVFPKAFMESDKIMRIPLEEDGTSIEIKVSLTAAKDLLGNVDDSPKAAAADFNFTGINPSEETQLSQQQKRKLRLNPFQERQACDEKAVQSN